MQLDSVTANNCNDAPNVSMQFNAMQGAQYAADNGITGTTFALVGVEAANSAGLASGERFG